MKTIGELVVEFMKANDWKVRRMADEVSKHNSDKPVLRQNIEGLIAKGNRKPHFIAALAKAMGTSVDALLTGGDVALPPPKITDPVPFGHMLIELGKTVILHSLGKIPRTICKLYCKTSCLVQTSLLHYSHAANSGRSKANDKQV